MSLGYCLAIAEALFFILEVIMKNTKVSLVPLTADDREQFILDNQWAFKYGAMMEFGERDDHIDDDGEIISRATIENPSTIPKAKPTASCLTVRRLVA